MHKRLIFTCIASLSCLPLAAGAQDARSILETAQQKQLERWEGVDTYVVRQTAMGHAMTSIMVRTTVELDDGSEHTLFMPVNPQSGVCSGPRRMTPEQLEQFADAQEMTGDALSSEVESGMEAAGLPPGMLAATGSSPNATLNPRVMMGANAEFLRAAADAERNSGDDGSAARSGEQMAQFMEKAQLVGREPVNGREAFHLRAEGLDVVETSDGQEFSADAMSLWIDAEHYVPLRMQIDGTMTHQGETRPVTIESLHTDYRNVAGSRMYEPYRLVTKIGGMLTPEQEAQMQQAQAEMAKMEQQLANMPASQRAMMESMIGPQIEAMRSMASGGGFETEITVNSIEVNPANLADASGNCESGAH